MAEAERVAAWRGRVLRDGAHVVAEILSREDRGWSVLIPADSPISGEGVGDDLRRAQNFVEARRCATNAARRCGYEVVAGVESLTRTLG